MLAEVIRVNSKKAVREIMNRKGIGTKQMADLLGTNMQTVCDRLGEGKSVNLSVEKLNDFLCKMNYKIVLIPDDVELQSGWYEVDSEPTKAVPTPGSDL